MSVIEETTFAMHDPVPAEGDFEWVIQNKAMCYLLSMLG